MRVQITDNIGSRDAASLGVDFRECLKGAEIDVSEDVAKRLIDGRFAAAVPDVQPPLKMKGVKKPEVQSEPAGKSLEPEAMPKGVKKTSE